MAPYSYKRVKVLDGPKERPTLEPNEDAALVVKRIFDLAESRNGDAEDRPYPQRRGDRQPQG